jgi:transcriptional regulator with XRE-family HTH domain
MPIVNTIAKRRKALGLSQVSLAEWSGISLPTIQNIESGKANPSLALFEKLGGVLGFEVSTVQTPLDWDVFCDLGLPLSKRENGATPLSLLKPIHLIRFLIDAAIELKNNDAFDRERKSEAISGLILAIQIYFPTFYRKKILTQKGLYPFIPTEITGRLVKMKNHAGAILSQYL